MNQPLYPGDASPGTWSSASRPRIDARVQLLLLLLAGAAAAILHESFRWPMRMPGHHGLEWFAILMFARVLSTRPWAAFAVACGAALTALTPLGGHEGSVRPLTYLVQGFTLDLLFLLILRWRLPIGLAVLAGALAHALSPLLKAGLALTGVGGFGSLSKGLAFPLMTHAGFGAVGAAVGLLLALAWQRARDRRRH